MTIKAKNLSVFTAGRDCMKLLKKNDQKSILDEQKKVSLALK